MKVKIKKYQQSIDLLPGIYLWFGEYRGIAISWLIWSLEITQEK